jgi:hypothetical protein
MNAEFHISRKPLLIISLLCVILASSLFICTFMLNGSSGTSLENAVHVKNETELKNAIDNAPTGKSTTITLDKDITLTITTDDHNSNYYPVNIIIPADKDITLTSNKANGFYKLNGATNGLVLDVASTGVLRLDGIIVTHTGNTWGGGVNVDLRGAFYLYSGTILGNKASGWRGVTNDGVFIMSGGEISGCTAEYGGGVYNSGAFTISGGTISGNTADDGGGVHNAFRGTFTMTGGEISGNTATIRGGGVFMSYGKFTMSGGEISGNTANKGGGVYNAGGVEYDEQINLTIPATFSMSKGLISGNKADNGGGVYNEGAFVMSGGTINSNTATGSGGGVYNHQTMYGTFNKQGGKISENTASNGYKDVYPDSRGDGLPSGNDGFSDNNGWTANDNNGISIGGFSLRDIAITCVITTFVTISLALAIVHIASQKKRMNT